MKQLHTKWNRLSAKQQVAIHLSAVIILLFLCYVFLGCPPLNLQQAFRRAEKASMTGPAEILAQLHPAGYPYHGLVLARSGKDVAVFAYDRKDPSRSQLVYRENAGDLAVLAAPGDVLYQYEHTAAVPLVLFDGYKTAVRAQLDITLQHDGFQKTYSLETLREHPSCFCFLLSVRGAGPLGEEGAALRQLQEICSNSMAGNLDVQIPVTVQLYDGEDALILESESVIRSAAALAQKPEPGWPGYSGTMEDYAYCHAEERDRAWEEDILYLAQTCLDNHPHVTGEPVWTYTFWEPFGSKTSGFSDEIYREETRTAFIELVNQVIAGIPEYTDVQMAYEMLRIVASLGDIHSSVTVGTKDDEIFPVRYEYFTEDGIVSVYAVQVAEEYEDIYLGKLVAVNGIPVEEIIKKLIPYIPSENEYYPIRAIVSGSLSAKNALHAVGILGLEDKGAEFTFETGNGIVVRTITAVPKSEFQQLEMIKHPMTTDDAVMRHQNRNYWFEVLENNVLYMRISSLNEESDYTFLKCLLDAGHVLQEAEQPMRLIVDFRFNHGGPEHFNQWNQFIDSIQKSNIDSIYLLINEECVSSGVAAPYQLAKRLENAQLVGSPTAQFPNSPAAQIEYKLPNHGNSFYISGNYFLFAPDEEDTALRPDVTVYQTWNDYQNNIDTVLQYVLSLK